LNPSFIERGNDPKITFVGRDGFGVAGFLANLKDTQRPRFDKLQSLLKRFRPETETIEVWSPGSEVFWGLRDRKQTHPFNALFLSWGDRQLVGLLCVLFSARPSGSTIAIEEIDRGFHPSRYQQVIGLLTEAVYEGIFPKEKFQIILTTHSPSFVNKLSDIIDNVRLITRAASGGTVAHELQAVLKEKLGTDRPEQPIGEVWEMGLLEETLREVL
jgi:predicted ATPase